MANERIPNDTYGSPDDPYRGERAGDEPRRAQRIDNASTLQPWLAVADFDFKPTPLK